MLLLEKKQQRTILEIEERNRIFLEVFYPLHDVMLRQAIAYTNDSWIAAEDLVSDAYESIYKNLHTFNLGTNAKAWAMTILRNTFFNTKRKSDRSIPFSFSGIGGTKEVSDESTVHTDDDSDSGYFDRMDTSEANIDLGYSDEYDFAWKSLSVNHREVISLLIEGFSYAEIGKLIGIGEPTVKTRIFRARGEFEKNLNEFKNRPRH